MKQILTEALVFQRQSKTMDQEAVSRTLEQARDDVFVQLHLMNAIR